VEVPVDKVVEVPVDRFVEVPVVKIVTMEVPMPFEKVRNPPPIPDSDSTQ
jgi:hypothetical protein